MVSVKSENLWASILMWRRRWSSVFLLFFLSQSDLLILFWISSYTYNKHRIAIIFSRLFYIISALYSSMAGNKQLICFQNTSCSKSKRNRRQSKTKHTWRTRIKKTFPQKAWKDSAVKAKCLKFRTLPI